MTTVAEALSRAARQISVEAPSSWASATDDEHLEVKDFLDDTIADILDRYDLPSPVSASTTITGDGSETYSLPAGFRRLQRDDHAVFETTTQRRPLTPVTNDGEWTHLKEIGSTGADRFYRIQGLPGSKTISIFDEPASGVSIEVNYVTNNWLYEGSTAGDSFTSDDQSLIFDRRAVEAGIVYRWRERKGLDYMPALTNYEALMARLSNDARSRRVVEYGTRKVRSAFNIPVPDFIPAS